MWCCLAEGSSVTQAVEVEVVVRSRPDQGLRAAVGLTQQCHPEVVGEFTEGQDGYWPLVGSALERGERVSGQAPLPLSQLAPLSQAITALGCAASFMNGESREL